ncbi:MAG TPA: DinB family protein [Longimicrobiaceae bacterium]
MTTLSLLRRLFDSVFWADERALGSLEEKDTEARRYLHHVLAAERVWLLRLRGESSAGQEIWPQLSDEEARSLATENREGYRRYLDSLSEADLERAIDYANQAGRRFRTPIIDILMHVATHGAYHRGQVARARREAGGVPLNTDYITYVRELDELAAPSPTPSAT